MLPLLPPTQAAKAVSRVLRTSLGPKGMDKLLQGPDGDIMISERCRRAIWMCCMFFGFFWGGLEDSNKDLGGCLEGAGGVQGWQWRSASGCCRRRWWPQASKVWPAVVAPLRKVCYIRSYR